MIILRASVLILALLIDGGSSVKTRKLLNQSPFVMSHDAATGYLSHGLVDGWTRTQPVPFSEQLDCGARAFDARPAYSEELGLVWHHGPVYVNHSFQASVNEMMEWAALNPNDLVLVGISDCEGDNCLERVVEVLDELNLPQVTDCTLLATLTLDDAKAMAQLDGGGMLLFLVDDTGGSGVSCSEGNYDPSIDCSGVLNSTVSVDECLTSEDKLDFPMLSRDRFDQIMECAQEMIRDVSTYSCYLWQDSRDYPVSRMFAQLDAVAAAGPPSSGTLYQMQAIWQESTQSVILGELALSSLIRDERRSQAQCCFGGGCQSQAMGEHQFS